MQRVVRPITVALASALVLRLAAFLEAKNLGPELTLLVSVVFAMLFFRTVEYSLLEFPLRFKLLRRCLDPIYSIEGYWYERVTASDHPHSYACIEFDPRTNRFYYGGQNFTNDLALNATFMSETIEVRRDSKQIAFSFRADVHRPSRTSVRGYATINFHSDGKRAFTRGDGSFVESLSGQAEARGIAGEMPEMKEVGLLLERIAEPFVRRAISRRSIRDNADIEVLLRKYLESRGSQHAQ